MKQYYLVMSHFQIVAINNLNEPYNSDNIQTTPNLVNINEQVFFTYYSTSGVSFNSEEKWIWDFDYNFTSGISDQLLQTVIGEHTPFPTSFIRYGIRNVNVKVYGLERLAGIQTYNKTFASTNFQTSSTPITNDYYNNRFFRYVNPTTGKYYFGNGYISQNTILNINTNVISYNNPQILLDYASCSNKVYSIRDNNLYIINNNDSLTFVTSFPDSLTRIISDGTILYIFDDSLGLHTFNTTTNTIISSIILDDPILIAEYLNNNIHILSNTGELIKINSSLVTTSIGTITLNSFLEHIITLNNIYIRTSDTLYTYNTTTITSLTLNNSITNNSITYDSVRDRIYVLDDNNLVIIDNTIIETIPLTFIPKGIYFDKTLDSIIILNSTGFVSFSNKSHIQTGTYIFPTDNTQNYFMDGMIFSYNIINATLNYSLLSAGLPSFDYTSLLYQDTITFDVYTFPTIINGLEYAIEGETVIYTVDSGAEYYEWYLNDIKQPSSINELSITFTNMVRANIKCIIYNGYSNKTLYFKTSLSVGSAVIGKKYEGNVTDKLLFFNKEGDYLNFDYLTDNNGLNYWNGELFFNHNSNDTFKTIGLYTLEKVEAFKYESEDLYTRKFQLFNENGIIFQEGNDSIEIDRIEKVNNTPGFYSKWLISPNIQNKYPVGTEIILSDFYNITIDNSIVTNPILTSYNIINDLDSTSGTYLFTVLEHKKDGILVITKTENINFDFNYGYGDYRLSNNIIRTIPKGKVKSNNLIKIIDGKDYNTEWNEPYYKDLLYDEKKLSIVNSSYNDGVYSTELFDIKDKYIKSNLINFDLLTDFGIRLTSKTRKIFLSSSPVDFLPRSSNAFLNSKDILVWESVLNKDYTPTLLKPDLNFIFEQQTPSIDIFDITYKVMKVDQAKNILTENTTDSQDYKLIYIDGFTSISFTINNTSYSINFNSMQDLTNQLNSLAGLSVISVSNEIWIHQKKSYTITFLENPFKIEMGILKTNNPLYGIVGDIWVALQNSNYNGYIHKRIGQGNYHILYYPNWHTISENKKLVWVNPSEDFTYNENLIGDAYLEQNNISFYHTDVEKFIIENNRTFKYYGLDLYSDNTNLIVKRNYPILDNDYIDVEFLINSTAGYIASTSGFITTNLVEYIQVEEKLISETNNNISENFTRRIIFKDIDQNEGLTLFINGIDYSVPYNNLSVPGLTDTDDTILDVEETLLDWGNQRFDDGIKYHELLEKQGVLVWLDKTEALIDNIEHFDTLVIQSKYPNNNITYNVTGTLESHKILHSDIEIYQIGNKFSLTLNGFTYSIDSTGNIKSTLEAWKDKWSETILEQDIIIEYVQPTIIEINEPILESTSWEVSDGTNSEIFVSEFTSGIFSTSFYIGSQYDILRISTLEENTNIKYSVWVGFTPLFGDIYYTITDYRKHNQGLIISANEIRNNVIDFQSIGFATAMITNITGSKFPLNNQEYNLLFVDPSVLALSYQGAFWREDDIIGYNKLRSGFDWSLYDEFLYTNITSNTYYDLNQGTSFNITNAYFMEYDPINDNMWVSSLDNKVSIIKNTIIEELILGDNIQFMKYNPVNRKMYIICKNSNVIVIVDTNTLALLKTITVGTSPVYCDVDIYTGYVYCLSRDNNSLAIIDGITNTLLKTINIGNKPSKMVFDYNTRNFFIKNDFDNIISVVSAITNSHISNVYVGNGNETRDIIFTGQKVIVTNALDNTITIIDAILNKTTIATNTNPIFLEKTDTKLFVSTDTITEVYDITDFSKLDEINNSGKLKYIPISNDLLITNNTIEVLSIDDHSNICNLNSTVYFADYSTDKLFLSTTSGMVYILNQIPIYSTSGTVADLPISLSVREFFRYPRERFDQEEPIKFKYSWEDEDDSIFFYDFSGEQLYITQNNERIIDKGVYNYSGSIPLLSDNSGKLIKEYNTDLKQTTNPLYQQTIFDELYYDLNLIDSEDDIDPKPIPIQTFIGYNCKIEGTNKRTLKIERLENISYTFNTRLKFQEDVNSGYIDILQFNNNEIILKNSLLNFIELGYKKDQIIEITGKDINNNEKEAIFNNSGLTAKIISVYVNKLIVEPINKSMFNEESLNKTYTVLPPYRELIALFNIKMQVIPQTIAKITIKGQTEIEDERFKVMLNNFGHNINHNDIFIFDDYDINEAGIDWTYVNKKRKEMLLIYPEIYNYMGSYKSIINAINYFGYEDLELNEYYLNKETGKLCKVEIPDIFNNQVEGWTENDFIKKNLPNKKYHKTKLFNLTYRITDKEGTNILAYSLDEIIIKLLGLKKWLRENIMPVGTRLKDLTGYGETVATINIYNDIKLNSKFNIKEDLTIVDFDIEAYRQPVENNSKTYNVNLSFKCNATPPDYYQVNIYTFALKTEDKLRCVQKMSYYKTDLDSINFACDRNLDPYILVETIMENGYGGCYKQKKTYSIELSAYV